MNRYHVPKRIYHALEATDDFAITRGKRHLRIFVKGEFCGIVPHCVSGDNTSRYRAERNLIAQIKRRSR